MNAVIASMMFYLLQLSYVISKDIVCRQGNMMEDIFKNKTEFNNAVYKRKSEHDMPNTPRSLLQKLSNCTVYYGDLTILHKKDDKVFEEDIRYYDLFNLNKLRIIYGHVFLWLERYPEIKNLSFLSSLRMIQTSGKGRGFILLRSRIEMLDLRNVQFNVPYIGIGQNKQLCYLENFRTVNSSILIDITGNKDPAICALEGRVCSRSCRQSKGCWGPKDRHCFECREWKAGSECVNQCESRRGFFTPSKGHVCGRCHDDCMYGCFGPTRAACHSRPEVIEYCRKYMYFDEVSGRCKECSSVCFGDGYDNRSRLIARACTGNGNWTGPGGCTLVCPATAFRTVSSDGWMKCLPCHSHCLSGCRNASLSGCTQISSTLTIARQTQQNQVYWLHYMIEMPMYVLVIAGAAVLVLITIGVACGLKSAISQRERRTARRRARRNTMNIEAEYDV